MPSWSVLHHRYAAAVAVGLLVLTATAIAVALHRGRTGSTMVLAPISAHPVIAIAWRAVGQDVEPWSGVGLGEQVRHALSARGMLVTDHSALLGDLASDTPDGLAVIGQKQRALYVLGGTVGRKGQRSEVGMQLVRVRDSAPVWAATFWRDQSNLNTLASDLAMTVWQVIEAETTRVGRLSR
jgi:TolB-like protein